MSVSIAVDVECPACATRFTRRHILGEVVPDCFITPVEIVQCPTCQRELRPHEGTIEGTP